MATIHEMYDEAVRLKDAGDLEGAVAQLQKVLEVDDSFVTAHSAMAVYLQRLGKFDDAIAHAKRVCEIEPNDPFSYSQLSVVCMRCGRIPEAEEAKAKAQMVQAGGA